jgi:hypothetical protein
MKGQAALDFLMTYGWAILLVILVAGALFTLGIFDVGSMVGNRAVGFTQVSVDAFKVATDGTLTAKLENQVGIPISIDYVNATYLGTTVSNSSTGITNLGVGSNTPTLTVGDIGDVSSGNSYTITLKIGYTDINSNFSYVETGTLNGAVE